MVNQDRIKWILSDSVCVVDGWCWVQTPQGRTVCIGKEEDVISKGQVVVKEDKCQSIHSKQQL